jgi:hypothetical protein
MSFTANALWVLSCLPGSLAFHHSLRNVAACQSSLLLRLLRRNANTAIGRRYGFADIRSIAGYQARLPLSMYEDYREAIQRIGAGEAGVLTRDPVLLLEPTGGSTTAAKYIPYTAGLKAGFQQAIAPWIADVYGHYPGLWRGQAYWSVTPVTQRNRRTPGGIPIGFEEDSEYFGRLQRYVVRRLMAVPPLVRLIEDMAAFRYITLLFLLRSRNLALISVWNPTFLTLLLEPLPAWWPRLAADIAHGTLSPPGPLEPDLRQALGSLNRPDPGRADEIGAAFQTNQTAAAIHQQLWPQLRLISCWTEGHAALYAPQVAQLFPQAQVQGKGLLATEGVVSFPLAGYPGSILAIRSHFFEFLPTPEAGSERPLLAHELEQGGCYEVVLTTSGGLYRYRLHDVVEVVGRLNDCPLIRFVGKTDQVSDRFGEKLNERHVQQALASLLERDALRPDFAMLAYEEEIAGRPAYVLFIEIEQVSDQRLQQLANDLEAALQENFHYRYCRQLGQLQTLAVFRIEAHGWQTYLATCQAQGQRAGDIKATALHRRAGWSRFFQGSIIQLSMSNE